MPAIVVKPSNISRYLGRETSIEELLEVLPRLGMSVDEVGEDCVKAEYNPNRPDFSSPAGIARAISGLKGEKLGLPRYRVYGSKLRVSVHRSVRAVRPYIVAALVRDIELSSSAVEELIAMQEDLHWVIGRDRRKVAIGLHDYSKFKPPLIYAAKRLDSVRFVPLWEEKEMTPLEILSETETGKKYGHIIASSGLAPLIIDAEQRVISFPPVINAKLTELNSSTRDIFVDVTGTDFKAINQALNVLVTAMSEMGGKVCKVSIKYDSKTIKTPDLEPTKWRVKLSELNALVGINVSAREAITALKRMRLDAKQVKRDALEVLVPPYRVDILHQVDFAEELAMGIGYENLAPELPPTSSFGGLRRETLVTRAIREVMIGLGFTEAVNTTLSNRKAEFKSLSLPDDGSIKILNPLSSEYDTLRRSLLPGLLVTLANNKRNPYPQRFFEVGDVVALDYSKPERVVRKLKLACVTAHSTASYSEIKSIGEELARDLGVELEFKGKDYSFLIPGRSVSLVFNGREIGYMGEVHPAVLENLDVDMPVATLELGLDELGLL